MARLYTDETWRGVGTQPNFAREYPVIHNWLQANGSPTPQNIGDLYRTLEGRAKDSLTAPNLEEIDRIDQIDKYSLNPVRFLRIETEIHQRENDENLMKLWPKLRAALPQAAPPPDLQTVEQVKNWLSDPANQASLAQITLLNLSNLGLTTIPTEFATLQLPNLTELSLNDNRLTALPNGFLQNAPLLRSLYLGNNLLAALPNGFLQNAHLLQELCLGDNRLAALPDNFLQNAHQLQDLDLHNNLLTALPDGFPQNAPLLQELYLDNNNLTELPDGFLQNAHQLQALYLDNNNLTELPGGFLQNAHQLQELYLNKNNLTELPDGFLQNAHLLQELYLSNNLLATLPNGFLQNAPRLGSLSLSDNRLAALPNGFLQNAPRLRHLYLSNNLLTALPGGFLQNAPALLFLSLADNNLTTLPNGFLQNTPSDSLYVDLSHNTLRLVLFLNRRGICATVLGIGALAYATSGFALETCTDTPGIFWGSWTSCEPTVLGAALSTAGEVAATLNTTATAIFTSRAFISTAIGGAIADRIFNYVDPGEALGNRRHVCALIAGFAIQAMASYVNLGS